MLAPEQKSYGSKVGAWTDIYLLANTRAEFIGRRLELQGAWIHRKQARRLTLYLRHFDADWP
jgi:hypothetical protein